MNCCDSTSATCGTAFDATAQINPALSSFTCIGVLDSSVGLAMCPFVEEVCGPTKEYFAALSETIAVPIPTRLTQDYSCTYKIVATSGAPGFDMTTTATTGKILVGWIEYDIDDISVKTGTTYPDLGQIT